MADTSKWAIWALVLIAGLVAYNGGAFDSFLGSTIDTEVTTDENGVELAAQQACTVEDTTVTLLSQEKYNIDEAVTGSDRLLIKTDGVWIDKGSYADGSSVTLSPGDLYQAVMRENSTDHYPELVSGTVGYPEGSVTCRGTDQIYTQVLDYDTVYPNPIITNPDGSLNSAGAYNIGAGEQATFSIRLRTTSQDGYGSPAAGNNRLVCEYNTSDFTIFTIDDAGSDVAVSTSGNVPNFYKNNLTGSPGHVVVEFAPVEDLDEVKLDFTVKASTTVAAPVQDIFCAPEDTCWFRDPITNDVTAGVEDAYNVNKCQTTATGNVSIGLT